MSALSFAVAVLAVWRVTHLFQAEDGPFDLIFRFRRKLGDSQAGHFLDCFYCLSLWVALPPAIWLASSVVEGILYWPALSGGAILLQRFSERK